MSSATEGKAYVTAFFAAFRADFLATGGAEYSGDSTDCSSDTSDAVGNVGERAPRRTGLPFEISRRTANARTPPTITTRTVSNESVVVHAVAGAVVEALWAAMTATKTVSWATRPKLSVATMV